MNATIFNFVRHNFFSWHEISTMNRFHFFLSRFFVCKKAIYYVIKELICYNLHAEWHFHSNGFCAHLLWVRNETTRIHTRYIHTLTHRFMVQASNLHLFLLSFNVWNDSETVTDYPLCNPKDQKVKIVCIVFTAKCTTLPSKINENLLCSHSIHLWTCIKKRKKYKEDSFSWVLLVCLVYVMWMHLRMKINLWKICTYGVFIFMHHPQAIGTRERTI